MEKAIHGVTCLLVFAAFSLPIKAQTLLPDRTTAAAGPPATLTTADRHSAEPSPAWPKLAAAYEGRWEQRLPQYGSRTTGGDNSFTITDVDPDGREARGKFTTIATSSDSCATEKEVPMTLRWVDAMTVVVKTMNQDPRCKVGWFNLTREPSGRFTFTSKDGLTTSYFDPK